MPRYLEQAYWWAYVHPRAVRLFERQWLVNLILWGNYDRLRDAALAALGGRLDGRTLQVACVYGDLTQRIVERLAHGAELHVVDVLRIQLDNLARKLAPSLWRARGSGPPEAPVALIQGDSVALEFRAASYDRVLLFFLLHEQPALARRETLAEAFRVVKPGGRIVIVDYHRPHAFHPLKGPMWGVFRALEPFALDLWRDELTNMIPHASRTSAIYKRTFFGGLYQLVSISV